MGRSRSRHSSRSHHSSSASVNGVERHKLRNGERERQSEKEREGRRRSRNRTSPNRARRRNDPKRRSRSVSRGNEKNGLVYTYRTYSRSATRSRSRSIGYSGARRRRQGYEKPEKSRCLGVFGLSGYTTERQINEIFSKYGDIERVNVVYDAKSGRSRGFCFVYFDKLDDAVLAKESCSGLEIDYRRIRVDYSLTQRPHTPTPGIYKGRSVRDEDRNYRTSRSSSRRRRRPRSESRSSRGSRSRR